MIYDLISGLYDKVNGSIDYKRWADFIEAQLAANMTIKPELGLDLGCGTGKMTLELASRGYDMTGVDYSSDMLCRARENAEGAGLFEKILWLCQDITDFELYGTVDFAVCCLDTMNHLTENAEFSQCLALVYNYLSPDGIFIFDINCKAKFEKIYADHSYVIVNDDDMLVWQNYYRKSSGLCDFYITLFEKDGDVYHRHDEVQSERMYTIRSVKSMLKRSGFELLGVYSDFDNTVATDESERAYIVAKCIKPDDYGKEFLK